VNIPIANDTFYEFDEAFQLEISVPEAAVRAGVIDGYMYDPFTPSVNVKIIDDDSKLQINEIKHSSVNYYDKTISTNV